MSLQFVTDKLYKDRRSSDSARFYIILIRPACALSSPRIGAVPTAGRVNHMQCRKSVEAVTEGGNFDKVLALIELAERGGIWSEGNSADTLTVDADGTYGLCKVRNHNTKLFAVAVYFALVGYVAAVERQTLTSPVTEFKLTHGSGNLKCSAIEVNTEITKQVNGFKS